MGLTNDEVDRLLRLLDDSHFDELHLETDGIKLSLRRSGAGEMQRPAPAAHSATQATPPIPAVRTATDLHEIRAPMLGTFYGAPRPGAEPFVKPGSRVTPDGAVAILEVMKLMNLVAAGVAGVVEEILVRDGELVEFDQVLMRVRQE